MLKHCAKEQKKEVERYEKEIFRSNGTRIILCNGTDRLFRRQQTLTACGSSSSTTETTKAAETTAAAAAAPSGDAQKLTMGTGGTTGTYYAFGGVIANVLNSKDIGVNINVQSTGASKANIYLVNDGEADLAIVQNDVMDYAYNGTDLFAEEGAAKDFTTVAALYAEVCQIVSSGDIKSVADLKGKRVSVGDAGSGVEFNARQILEAYDISFDDIQVNNLGFGDSADASMLSSVQQAHRQQRS